MATGEGPELSGGDRWASVSRREWPTSGADRHIVARGGDTSACGTTALPKGLWRGNTTKPPCVACCARYQERENR